MIDLLDFVGSARWESNRLESDNSGNSRTVLEWGGDRNDQTGFVNLWPGSVNEVGSRNNFLVTRPKGGIKGTIKGVLPSIQLLQNPQFIANVGFLHDAPSSSGVVFQVFVHYQHEGKNLTHRVFSLYKERNGRMTPVTIDLSFLAGKSVQIEFRVDAGLRPNILDLPIWFAPKIEERETPYVEPTRFFEIRPTELTVNRQNEGGGDDPFLGVLFFRSSIGVPGSTLVEVLDLLSLISEDVTEGVTIPINDSAAMVVRDIGMQGNIATLISTVFVAIEEDQIGRSVVREKLKEAATRSAFFLAQTAEDPNDTLSIIVDFEGFVENLKNATQGINPSDEPSGGGVSGGTGGFLEWIARAHDQVGVNAVSLVVGPAATSIETTPNERSFPVNILENKDFWLDYNGEGASWTLKVEVRIVEPNYTLAGNPTLPTNNLDDVL